MEDAPKYGERTYRCAGCGTTHAVADSVGTRTSRLCPACFEAEASWFGDYLGVHAGPTASEPPPDTASIHPAVWDLVRDDMQSRDRHGLRRHGTRLRGFNGRDALVDAYQEALDLVVYLRQALYERDKR